MKKLDVFLFVTALSFLLATSSFAKENAYKTGNIYLSGSTNLDFSLADNLNNPEGDAKTEDHHTLFGFGGRIGYFVMKGLEVGIGLDYSYDKFRTKTFIEERNLKINTVNQSYLAGVQGGYFFDLGGIDPFANLLLGYAGSSTDAKPEGGDTETMQLSGFSWDAAIGINFLLNYKVGVAPAIYYDMQTLSGDDKVGSADKVKIKETDSRFGFRVAFNLFL